MRIEVFLGRLVVVLVCFAAFTATAEVQIRTPLQRIVLFGGTDSTIEVPVVNPDPVPTTQPLDVRLFQLTSSIAAPVGERRPWKAVSLLASQTALERLELRVPEVRAITVFRVAFYSGENEIGRCSLVAIPPGLLAEIARNTSLVADLESPLAKEMAKLDIGLRGFDDVAPGNVVFLGPISGQSALREAGERIKTLTSRGATVILFLSTRDFARAEAAGLESLTGVLHLGSGKILQAKQLELSQLSTTPAAQLAFHQLLTLALQRDTFPWLHLEE